MQNLIVDVLLKVVTSRYRTGRSGQVEGVKRDGERGRDREIEIERRDGRVWLTDLEHSSIEIGD